ncbi:MAG: hypothetical protein ABIE68_04315 [bacterium]
MFRNSVILVLFFICFFGQFVLAEEGSNLFFQNFLEIEMDAPLSDDSAWGFHADTCFFQVPSQDVTNIFGSVGVTRNFAEGRFAVQGLVGVVANWTYEDGETVDAFMPTAKLIFKPVENFSGLIRSSMFGKDYYGFYKTEYKVFSESIAVNVGLHVEQVRSDFYPGPRLTFVRGPATFETGYFFAPHDGADAFRFGIVLSF